MINTFNEYKEKCLNTWIKDNQSNIRTILGIVGESGEVAEKFKKYIRGDYDKDVLIEHLKKELGDVLYYICMCCYEFGFTMNEVATININKLQKRLNENKIKGSGDER